ncbi:MAG: carbohydrate kinase family protein [Omnitrophica WOR_2 bacterium]
MSNILVSGLINLEISLKVDSFPIGYTPVRFPFDGINSSVSGVGFNLAKALTVLGNRIDFLSIIGKDQVSRLVIRALEDNFISSRYIQNLMETTAHSVILYDDSGRRMINTDLKNIQELVYPPELGDQALERCPVAVLCNINFSRPFLQKAQRMGKLIATDVHTISDIQDEYNRDFMAAADILFMSDEKLPCTPKEWIRRVLNTYGNEIIVIGMGTQGVLISVKSDRFIEKISAVKTRPVVNTIGAGDALFACFLHYYVQNRDPYEAIRKAVVFASYKVGEASAAEGFLSEIALEDLYYKIRQ